MKEVTKKLIIFDLDGTLTLSKHPIAKDVAETLCSLLAIKKVLVIGGAAKEQFFEQFLTNLQCDSALLSNLYIMPTSGGSFFIYKDEWREVYRMPLTTDEKTQIFSAINKALALTDYAPPEVVYGEVIEDRDSQISFSALGQRAPLKLKEKWDPDRKKREPIVQKLKECLPEFDVKMGGTTTIDITKKGINKAYGVRYAINYLKLSIEEAIYIGDALYENGNDAIVKETTIATLETSGPEETKKIIKALIDAR